MGRHEVKSFLDNFSLIEYVRDIYDMIEKGSKYYICCPFHTESTPSCLISETGFYCFGCQEHGSVINFLTRTTGEDINEIATNPYYSTYNRDNSRIDHKNKYYNKRATIKSNNTTNPSSKMVDYYHNQLLKNSVKLDYLYRRCLTDASIMGAKIGYGTPQCFSKYSKPRYMIPVYKNRKLVTIRYRIDPDEDDGSEPKYLAHPNTPTILYHIDVIDRVSSILYVGSELDAICLLRDYRIPAIAPPGENVFKPEWAKLFQDKNILIWLDNDVAGYTGSLKLYKYLAPYAKNVTIYKWGYHFPKKYDIGDYIKDYGVAPIICELNGIKSLQT